MKLYSKKYIIDNELKKLLEEWAIRRKKIGYLELLQEFQQFDPSVTEIKKIVEYDKFNYKRKISVEITRRNDSKEIITF